MILTDTLQKAPVGGLKVPNFKGHAAFIVRDKKGRVVKHYEADNVVTNAVRDVLTHNNFLGAVDPSAITPLWEKMYGGILGFVSNFNDMSADSYWIPPVTTNGCPIHAGHDNPDDLSDDPYRGFYNTALRVKTKNSVTQVWEWGPNVPYQIPIAAVGLCPESVGNVGTPQDTKAFRAFTPFELFPVRIPSFTANMISYENVLFMIDDFTGGWFEMGEPGEYQNMNSRFETHYLTIYKKRLAFKKAGLYECDNVVSDFITHFTIDLGARNIYCQPAYCYTGGYLWIFSNITGIGGPDDGDDLTYSQTMNWWKIDVVSEVLVDSGTWVNNPGDVANRTLGPCCIEARGWYGALAPVSPGTRSIFPGIPYIYDNVGAFSFLFPVCDGPVSHATAPAFNVVGTMSYTPQYNAWTVPKPYVDKQYEYMDSMYSDQYPGMVVMPGRVLNGHTFYTCQEGPLWVDDRDVFITKACKWAFVTPNKPTSLVVPIGCGMSWGGAPRFVAMNKFLLTTKLNLPSELTKEPGESLTIQYTLTQI